MKVKPAKIKVGKLITSPKEMERAADAVGKASVKRLDRFIKGKV